MKKVNLNEKFALFNDHWSPKIVGDLNGDQDIYLKEGKFAFIPKGIEHLPIAEKEVYVS